MDYEIEKEIYNWIDFNRSLGNAVTTWSIGVEYIKNVHFIRILNQAPCYKQYIDLLKNIIYLSELHHM